MRIGLIEIVKRYDDKYTLGPINLTLEPGSSHGLIGPNGAGKTTLMNIIAGKLVPTSGQILFNGEENFNLSKKQLSYIPTQIDVPGYLTGQELIQYILGLNQCHNDESMKSTHDMLSMFSLKKNKDKLVKDYSFGMKRKCILIAFLAMQPKIIILDEPFQGLDYESVEALRTKLIDLKKAGSTILISSHIREVLNSLCDSNLFIKDGTIT